MQRLSGMTVLLTLAVLGTALPAFGNWQEDLEQLWNDYAVPTAGCQAWVVQQRPQPILRGFKSGHACLLEAVQALRVGHRTLAFNWLEAGQCANAAARAEVSHNKQAALDHLLRTYGPQVPQQ
jgi:hypothetical protein